MENKTNGLAIASLICALIGLIIYGLPLGIIAIILGALSWNSGMGKAGVFIGIFNIIMVLIYLGSY